VPIDRTAYLHRYTEWSSLAAVRARARFCKPRGLNVTRVPTRFPEPNDVLRELVEGIRGILGESFCGAYLQGSFALGDADEHSDVDFLIVTREEIGDEQLAQLQPMHRRIYARDVPWARHLEGSYVPSEALRRVDPARSEYLYLDNGASELIWSDHCNTAVVR
jgi:predicted nucleotidyltransferase